MTAPRARREIGHEQNPPSEPNRERICRNKKNNSSGGVTFEMPRIRI
jgi:hypothetical protein